MILLLLLLILTLFGKASTIFHAMKTELQKILDPHSHTQFRTVLGQATIADFIHGHERFFFNSVYGTLFRLNGVHNFS
jgi:hypothetical protein